MACYWRILGGPCFWAKFEQFWQIAKLRQIPVFKNYVQWASDEDEI